MCRYMALLSLTSSIHGNKLSHRLAEWVACSFFGQLFRGNCHNLMDADTVSRDHLDHCQVLTHCLSVLALCDSGSVKYTLTTFYHTVLTFCRPESLFYLESIWIGVQRCSFVIKEIEAKSGASNKAVINKTNVASHLPFHKIVINVTTE